MYADAAARFISVSYTHLSSATFAGPLEKLSPGKSALFADYSLSEPLRGEFELSVNAFSRFSGA